MEKVEITLFLYDCVKCGKPRQTKKENHDGICRKCKKNQPIEGQGELF